MTKAEMIQAEAIVKMIEAGCTHEDARMTAVKNIVALLEGTGELARSGGKVKVKLPQGITVIVKETK